MRREQIPPFVADLESQLECGPATEVRVADHLEPFQLDWRLPRHPSNRFDPARNSLSSSVAIRQAHSTTQTCSPPATGLPMRQATPSIALPTMCWSAIVGRCRCFRTRLPPAHRSSAMVPRACMSAMSGAGCRSSSSMAARTSVTNTCCPTWIALPTCSGSSTTTSEAADDRSQASDPTGSRWRQRSTTWIGYASGPATRRSPCSGTRGVGLLALEYAIRHPDRVSHLILMNTAPASHADMLVFRSALTASRSPEQTERIGALRSDPAYQRGDIAADAEYYRIHFGTALRRPELLDQVVRQLRVGSSPEGIVAARAIEDSALCPDVVRRRLRPASRASSPADPDAPDPR